MHWPNIEIDEVALAQYSLLKKYCVSWATLDINLLKEILDPNIEFDAPGIPFDIIGIDKVLDAHKVWFENLKDENSRNSSPFEENRKYSCYEVFTQLYPYDYKAIFPYMQLSYFVKDGFYKIYFFDILINPELSKITRIHTRHIKFLVNSEDYEEYVRSINESSGFSSNK